MQGAYEYVVTGTMKDYDQTSVLPTITVLVLSVAGEFDEVGPKTVERHACMIPGTKFVSKRASVTSVSSVVQSAVSCNRDRSSGRRYTDPLPTIPESTMAQSPEEQTAKMVESLPATTGRSMDQWLALTKASGKAKHGELVSWLKTAHHITHGYANLIAHYTLKSDAGSIIAEGGDLVAEMFSGDKVAVRPIFDALMTHIRGFGSDLEESPKKGYLSLRRKTQFATLHPSTKARFDVGIKIKGLAPAGRLEAAGSWNAMMSHRVRLASPVDVDAELVGWLRQAYEGA